MPKHTDRPSARVRTPAPAPTLLDPVSDLLQAAKAPTTPGMAFSSEARSALERILAHNDASPRRERVSRVTATALLNEHFDWTGGVESLERAVRRVFGRKSWGTK